MFNLPSTWQTTPAARNEQRTEQVQIALKGMRTVLQEQMDAIDVVLAEMGDPESYGTDDALTMALRHGRADFIGRMIADSVLRHNRDLVENALKATAVAGGYEITAEEA